MFLNIIDADASLSAATKFSVPKAVKDVSLGHIHKIKLEKTEVPTKESSYLLLSQAGAITSFHQDFSGTSVMYFFSERIKQSLVHNFFNEIYKYVPLRSFFF